MKWLKLFKKYRTKEEEEVAKICKQYGIKNWSINKDGLIDVTGNVDLSGIPDPDIVFFPELTKLPLKFGIVTGYFDCSYNQLTTLEGAPKSVGGLFDCSRNKLTTLEGSPESVDGSFSCSNNKLSTLKGAPQSVDGDFFCNWNKLTTLEGAPYSVSGNFLCQNNPLPLLIQNNIKHIKHIIANQEMYHIYNKDGSINEYRFKLMMDSMD